jgi:hypothetical protein
MTDGSSGGHLERLRRWEDAGGTWRVAARRAETVTVALCRCDGGEEVDRFTSSDPVVLNHVGDRETSEDPANGLAD